MSEYTNRFCTQCGAQLPSGARFCSRCGASVSGQQDREQRSDFGRRAADSFEKSMGGILYFLDQTDYIPDEPTEELFIAENIPYYREKFHEMRVLKQKVSINWAALFFGVLWMLYRKMYGVAAAAVGIMLISGCLGGIGGMLGLALTVCSGLFGNYLYMMTVQKRVTELRKYEEPARSQYLEKYAGVSNTGVAIGVALVALSSLPFWLLFGLSFIGMFL